MGADKIRINPGNIGSAERVKSVVSCANEEEFPSGLELTRDRSKSGSLRNTAG